MAISLKDLRKERAVDPPRIIIYGPEGMGKTSLAAQADKPVFLQVEKGTPAGLELDSFGHLTSYAQVMEAIEVLYNENHDFKTVVIDSLSELEKLIFRETCERGGKKTIEDFGYGKGYKEADYVWTEVIDGVNALRRDRGMTVVLIAHAKVDRFDDPQTSSYSRYGLSLHERAAAMVSREVDAILLVKQDVTIKQDDPKASQGAGTRRRADGGETRWIYCEGRPAFTAKNRYDMPDKIMFPRGQGFAALAKYFPQSAAAEQQSAA